MAKAIGNNNKNPSGSVKKEEQRNLITNIVQDLKHIVVKDAKQQLWKTRIRKQGRKCN